MNQNLATTHTVLQQVLPESNFFNCQES